MSNFFEELKNRNVYKVATAYAITSWLIIQVVNTVGPNLNWPDSIASWITRIILVGFPIVLVLTWLYEFTPQGLKRTGKVQQETVDNRRAGRRLNRVIIGTLSVLICFMLVERVFLAGNTSINKQQKASIAVLPFDHLSLVKDEGLLEDQKILASAIPAQILIELGQISGLLVPAKTSCWLYRDRSENVTVIAKELGVNYILEGSVQYVGRGNRIKINTRLINGNNGWTLWSENFEDDLDEIENIQEKIGREIASQLKVQLLPSEEDALASKLSKDPEAYRLYIKGREYATRGTSEDLDRAVDLLNEALELDPELAEAHAQLSRVYPAQFFRSNLPKEERNEKTKYHLEKALEYGPDKPEVLVASSIRKIFREPKDSSMVIADLRKAIDINPNYADAYWYLARAVNWANQRSLAMKYAEKAVQLDPFNSNATMLAQVYFYYDKDHKKAFNMLDRIIKKDSSSDASRYKGLFLAHAPYGDLAQSYILIHEAGKREPNDLFNLNYHLMNSLTLDLAPVAEKYGRLLQMAYPENEAHTYNNLSVLYDFKGEYNKWQEMVDFWAEEKDLNPNTEVLDRVYIQMGMKNINKALGIFETSFSNELASEIPADSISFISYFTKNQEKLILYSELLRLNEDNVKADSLANILCDAYDMGSKIELAPVSQTNQALIECLYSSNDTTAFVKALEDQFFTQKDRLEVFLSIKSSYYPRFEKHKEVKALFDRITEETHRMRAEVIEYLKEEGDWNPSWDKELGLE